LLKVRRELQRVAPSRWRFGGFFFLFFFFFLALFCDISVDKCVALVCQMELVRIEPDVHRFI
jgi:hypothetical protein